jgi:tripartite ATP-independent transporter DctM subunit
MEFEIILLLLLLVTLIAFRVPVGFALMLVGFIGFVLQRGLALAISITCMVFYGETANYYLIVLPLFVITSSFALRSDIAKNAYDLAYSWLARMKSGMAIATVGACALFGACTGSSLVCAITIGKVSIPEMKRYGHGDAIACGTVAAAGTLGMMIPPSGMLVLYGIITDLPLDQLLIAGLLPGIVSAIIYIIGIIIFGYFKPDSMMASGLHFTWKAKFGSLYKAWGIMALFLSIVGGVYSGIFTVTEAAAVGAAVAFLMLMTVQGRWENTKESFMDGAKSTATIFTLIMGGYLFSRYITMTGMASYVAEAAVGLPFGPLGILAIVLLLYIPLGMFLEPVAIMLITIPVILPAITKLGFDAIWFGVIFIKMIELGNITPPIGMNVYVIKGIAPDVPIEEIFKGCGLFLFLDILALILLVAFPDIILWLPSKMLN